MACRPPWEFIQAMVSGSRRVRQSQRMFPWEGVLIRRALWPMASFGVVVME